MPTPKKPLAKNCQKAPAKDAKSMGLWPPKGGTPYTVQDGDHWGKLAADWSVTPRQLIGYNFNTGDPREVNWYLDHYVGCTLRTENRCNWRFSSGLTPGVIYRPWQGYPGAYGDPVTDFDFDPWPTDEPIPSPLSTRFRIRMLAGGAWSPKYAAALDNLYFEIENLESRDSAYYRYTGAGLGKGTPGGATLKGDWNVFSTSAPMMETEFDGFTRFTTAGGGPWTLNYLHLFGTPEGVDSVYLAISTGFTLGLGASFTVGEMLLLHSKPPD
ncbi:MAG: hypothetical protein ACRC33_23705 [Gemmataceae bacterium]